MRKKYTQYKNQRFTEGAWMGGIHLASQDTTDIQPYIFFEFRSDLSAIDLFCRGDRIVVPATLTADLTSISYEKTAKNRSHKRASSIRLLVATNETTS